MTRRSDCRPRLSPRGLADKHRRQSERAQDARDYEAARTTYRTDASGRTVCMVGWSSESLAKWEAEQTRVRQVMKAKASWERCPVCTTQCTQNECKDGCAIASKERVTVTSPPTMPRMKGYHWFGLCALAVALALLLTYQPWHHKPPLSDADAVKECLGYGPVKASDYDRNNPADYERVMHMDDVCNQAAKAIRTVTK